MQVGMIGLGRMGGNMVRRFLRGGHACVVYDVSRDAVGALAKEGATGAASMDDFVARLARPRTVWLKPCPRQHAAVFPLPCRRVAHTPQ